MTRLMLVTTLLALPGFAAPQDGPYAIVGARIATVAGATHESGTLLMRDGLIAAVGPAVAAPPDARVLDGKGLTLTPGLIDGLSGIGLPAPAPRAPGGERASGAASGARPDPLTPASRAVEMIRLADALRARDSGVTTALVIPGEGVLPGRSVLINTGGDTVDAMVLVEPAAQHIQMTTLGRRYPGSLMGTLALVRQSLLDARHHAEEGAAYARSPRGRKRPRHDERLAAWHEVVAGRIPLVVGASRENDVRRAVALADEFAIRVIVAGTPMAHRVTDIVRSRRLPLLLSVNFDPPRPLTFGFFRGTDEEKEKREIEEAEASPARLHEAGIPFALVSGHAKDFLAGVRKAIERGLPREAALRAVTLGAAEVLGIADRLGTLEIGKIANLVAWSGDPLTKQAKVKMVFVDGQLHEPEERPEGEKREPKGGVPGQ